MLTIRHSYADNDRESTSFREILRGFREHLIRLSKSTEMSLRLTDSEVSRRTTLEFDDVKLNSPLD